MAQQANRTAESRLADLLAIAIDEAASSNESNLRCVLLVEQMRPVRDLVDTEQPNGCLSRELPSGVTVGELLRSRAVDKTTLATLVACWDQHRRQSLLHDHELVYVVLADVARACARVDCASRLAGRTDAELCTMLKWICNEAWVDHWLRQLVIRLLEARPWPTVSG